MDVVPDALSGTATLSSPERRAPDASEPRYRPTYATSIAGRMDQVQVTRLHLAILAICALGFAFDLLEVTLGGALSTVFSAAPRRLTASELSRLVAAIYVGA